MKLNELFDRKKSVWTKSGGTLYVSHPPKVAATLRDIKNVLTTRNPDEEAS